MDRANRVADLLFAEQDRLVAALEDRDTQGRFRSADWNRTGLGHGRTRVLEQGLVFERAGLTVSVMHGDRSPLSVVDGPEGPDGYGPLDGLDRAGTVTALSLVAHPVNPYAPSCHAEFHYAERDGAGWFGAVVDLTPAYGFDEDAVHFHRTLRAWCDRHDLVSYARGKTACDEYFWLPHRNEMRGVGGVFFDRLAVGSTTDPAVDSAARFTRLLEFVGDGLDAVTAAYLPIVDRRCWLPYQDRQRSWQLLRRGRYVEFDLRQDRDPRSRPHTNGNVEAILMSLPPMASWGFQIDPEPGSPEADTARFLRPTDWAGGTTRRESIGIGP